MTFFTELMSAVSNGDVIRVFTMLNLHYFLRLIIAALCGFMIGRERRHRAKEAGIRTHCIVACAAALMMIVSKYAYFDLISGSVFPGAEVRLDPSRVASTIVSGIGFLGAGMIFVHRQTVTGLTTAAGIWATAGIGMAIGAGMYSLGIAATILILIIHFILHRSRMLNKAFKTKLYSFNDVSDINFKDEVEAFLKNEGIHIVDVYMSRKEDLYDIKFLIEVPGDYDEKKLITQYDCDSSIKAAL